MNAAVDSEHGLSSIALALLAAGLALALYVATAAPWLTWAHDGADGGDLIAAVVTGGVPHPSGYPTYCLLGRLFALLPLGNMARRLTLFSTVAAAGSAAWVFLLVRNLLSEAQAGRAARDTLALGAALVWAAGPILWSQAIIAEVYALHAFFVALALYLASRRAALERARVWLGLGLALGLGLGNHLTLALLLPGLALWLRPLARPRRVAAWLVGLALGLAVYLYVPLAARGAPPISWGDARDWDGLWWLVSGQPYRRYLFALPLAALPGRLVRWAQLGMGQLTLPGVALALLGLEARWQLAPRGWPAASLALAALPSAYAIGYGTGDSYVYLLPAFMVGATWLAQGALAAGRWLALRRPWLPWAGRLAPMLLALWLVVANYGRLDLSRDRTVAAWIEATLQTAPAGALLLSGADGHTFALDYAQWVERRGVERLVVDPELLPYPWYRRQLAGRYPELADRQRWELDALIAAYVDKGGVYLTVRREEIAAGWRLEQQGVLWQVMGRR
jgi:hypothetical protein